MRKNNSNRATKHDYKFTFQIFDEDHSFANVIRYLCSLDPSVEFCAYSIPHPSEKLVNLRIHSLDNKDAKNLLKQALFNLRDILSFVKKDFTFKKKEHMVNNNLKFFYKGELVVN